MCCAVTIGFGLEALSLFPMALFTPVVALMNTVFAGILGAVLIALLYPRAKQWGLIYSDMMDRADYRAGIAGWPGLALAAFSSLTGVLLAVNYIPVGTQESATPYLSVLPTGYSLAYAAGICCILILLGTTLMSPLRRSFGLVQEWEQVQEENDEASDAGAEGEE